MKNYIGTKRIKATPAQKHTCTKDDCPEGIEGYKVEYEDGYTSWSPKDVFEKAYTEVEKDKQLTRDKLCDIFTEANKQYGQFMPQQYVTLFLNICEKEKLTFMKE